MSGRLDEEKYKNALQEVDSKNIDYEFTIDSLELISVSDEFDKVELIKKYDLSGD